MQIASYVNGILHLSDWCLNYSGKNLNTGFFCYFIWKAENFGQKALAAVPKWHSLESSPKHVNAAAVDAMNDVMAKIVADRPLLVFLEKGRFKGWCLGLSVGTGAYTCCLDVLGLVNCAGTLSALVL